MLRLTPPSRIGEFYGLYGMVGRFSAITGPLIWAFVSWLTIQVLGLPPHVGQGIGVLVLLSLVVVSYVILRPVTDTPRDWASLGAGAADSGGCEASGFSRTLAVLKNHLQSLGSNVSQVVRTDDLRLLF